MIRTTLTLVAVTLSMSLFAQTRSSDMSSAFLEEQCKPELRKMLGNLKSALPSVQVAGREEGICQCARDRLFQDKALTMIRDADKRPIDPRLRPGDPQFQAYIFLKTTAAMHECYAIEFDAVARSIDPLK